MPQTSALSTVLSLDLLNPLQNSLQFAQHPLPSTPGHVQQSCGQSESDNFDGFLRQPCLEFIALTGTNGKGHCSCCVLVSTIDLSCDRYRSPRQGLFQVFCTTPAPFHCPGNGPCLSWRAGAVVQQIVHLLQQGARNPVELLREGGG